MVQTSVPARRYPCDLPEGFEKISVAGVTQSFLGFGYAFSFSKESFRCIHFLKGYIAADRNMHMTLKQSGEVVGIQIEMRGYITYVY